ncbi:MAG: hypothetical protein P8100_10845, partial [bacterium]
QTEKQVVKTQLVVRKTS